MADRRRRSFHLGAQEFVLAVVDERQSAAKHFEEQHADRIQVAALVHFAIQNAFRRHVLERADDDAFARQAGGSQGVGDAEIHDFDGAFAIDDDVFRLDIAVQHATAMGVIERLENLQRHRDGAFPRHGHEIPQHRAVDELHHDAQCVAILQERIKLGDVGVVELGLQLRLFAKAFEHAGAGGVFAAQSLDGYFAFEQQVHGAIDHTHSARAQFGGDAILADLLRHAIGS